MQTYGNFYREIVLRMVDIHFDHQRSIAQCPFFELGFEQSSAEQSTIGANIHYKCFFRMPKDER